MNLVDIWVYGILPAFFIFGVLSYAVHDKPAEVSILKITFAAIIWPFSVAVLICAFIGIWFK